MRNRNRPVLLVEDDSVDIEMMQRAFRELAIPNELIVAHNGEEALAFLRKSSAPTPCLVLLDLNMPRMNGLEFLKALREDSKLHHLVVVVLTTSLEERDKKQSFSFNVAGYVVKSMDYESFFDAIQALQHYWTVSEVPD